MMLFASKNRSGIVTRPENMKNKTQDAEAFNVQALTFYNTCNKVSPAAEVEM